MQNIYIIFGLILAVTVQQGSAIKCYVCNSHKDANCALDIPPDNLLRDCQEDYSTRGKGIPAYCRKISQVIEFVVNNMEPDTRIIRSCGFVNDTKTNYCYQRAGFGGRQIVCSCDKDNCNGAGMNSISLTAFAASIFMAIAILFKRILD